MEKQDGDDAERFVHCLHVIPVRHNLSNQDPKDLHKFAQTPYYLLMHAFLTVLVGLLMLATLGVLIAGMVGMVREGDPRRSNKLMQWRVLLQGLTLVLFMLLMSLLRS